MCGYEIRLRRVFLSVSAIRLAGGVILGCGGGAGDREAYVTAPPDTVAVHFPSVSSVIRDGAGRRVADESRWLLCIRNLLR
jgi:hypothetical protein